ncbi:MAG: hypothetical protein IT436_15370 [Phycisphaerales bacterium]|nr:hypothetical protein [Phycisphaerales bacterium]
MNARPLLLLLVIAATVVPGAAAQPPAAVRDKTGSTAAPPTGITPREGCVTAECHPGVKQHRFVHGPVQVSGCDACHKLVEPERHRFEAATDRNRTCALCHVIEPKVGAIAHKPFAEGDCLSCHDPHGSSEPTMLRGERYGDSCKACHEQVSTAHRFQHGPVSAGACGACHEPHASTRPHLLVAEGRDLCLKCHLSTGLEIESRHVVHGPALGDCLVCHDPHGTDNPAVLSADPVALCTACHESIARAMEGATTQHAAVTTQQSCLNCHAGHASDHARLLKKQDQALCFECHNKTITLKDGSKLQDMKKLIENGKSLHGAISQGSCVSCHDIHGGGHRRLLTNEYPSDIYYPFSENAYALCFSCHDRQMVMLSRTDTATGFRNGDNNLHYIHVVRDKKGRSCSVCHDAHATNRDRHIRDEVAYGPSGWKLPIRFETLQDGGTCGAGCHAPLQYNRVTPIVYPAERSRGTWKGEDLIPGVRVNPNDGNPPPAK